MDVRIPGPGGSLVEACRKPMSHILGCAMSAAARPRGSVLAGVFGGNDNRTERHSGGVRFSVVAGYSQCSE
jgi:hypothetical protein